MKSRKNARPDNVKERILEEATRLFAENGFEGTTIQAIADAVGIRKPSLIYHFASKDALREQVIEDLLSHWKEEIPRLLMAATDERDRFASVVMALVAFFQADRNRARLVVREILDRPDAVRAMVKMHIAPWVRLISDYIQLDRGRGLIRSDVDPQAYIVQVVLMVLGTMVAQEVAGDLVEGGEMFPGQMVAELVRISRDALFVEPGRGTEGAP